MSLAIGVPFIDGVFFCKHTFHYASIKSDNGIHSNSLSFVDSTNLKQFFDSVII